MNIIITMAGEGRRFIEAGYSLRKYELQVKGRTMFEWAISSLSSWFRKANFIFVSRTGSEPFVREKCKILGIERLTVKEIDVLTKGQASTALIAVDSLPQDSPIIIYNIDTYIQENVLNPDMIPIDCQGWIPVFSTKGDHWSFVEQDDDKVVRRVTEKVRISKWATIGLYYFKSSILFKEAYSATYGDSASLAQYKETYVAPMYNYIIQHRGVVVSEVIPAHHIFPLGTPTEVKNFTGEV